MTDSPVPLAAHPHPDLSIDQQLALRTAATRLHSEFGEHFGVETIERFLHSSYDQFAGRATVPNFLPLLAERWANQRLTALARVEGKITDAKPTVLFLCTHNAGRSQMALGYFNHLAGDKGVAWSGDSPNPATRSTRPRYRRWPRLVSTSQETHPHSSIRTSFVMSTWWSPSVARPTSTRSTELGSRTGTQSNPPNAASTASNACA